ncbi:MAG: phage holin family protein [Bacteroidales bacterium]|nr:phage holin family protein [Bacteroidales bacterium]
MADSTYQHLIDDSKRYLRMRYDMLRLELLEKLSRIVALILLVVVSTVLALAAFIYFTFALVAWLTPMLGAVLPLCIVGGVFVLLLILGIVFRKSLFINPLISQLSHILFYETPKSESDENEQTA